MLNIPKATERAFRLSARRRYLDTVATQAATHYPAVVEGLSRDELTSALDTLVYRAAAQGFGNRLEAWRYIRVALRFGTRFDEDPFIPWAQSALDRTRCPGGFARMRGLTNAAEAIEKPGAAAVDVIAHVTSPGFRVDSRADMIRVLPSLFRVAWPSKAHALGEPALADLADAAACEQRDETAATIDAVVRFLLGHGYVDDPLLPRINEAAEQGRDAFVSAVAKATAARCHGDELGLAA